MKVWGQLALGLACLILAAVCLIHASAPANDPASSQEILGDKAFQSHDLAQAEQHWRAALAERPRDSGLCNKLAIGYMLRQEFDAAVSVLERGLAVEPEHVGLNYNRALAYYYLDDTDAALAAIDKVLCLATHYPDARYLKGLCFEKLERPDDARQAFIEELNVNPGSRRAWRKVRKDS